MSLRRWTIGAALALGAAAPAWAADEDKPAAPVAITVTNTMDLWRNTRGGLKVGDTTLDKFQILATLDGAAAGLDGWSARIFYFRTNGERLSGGRTGDIQTASNIEALSADRLMVAWVARKIGDGDLRVGLLDLNADFDSIDIAGLFINSSHGIGPDLSKTGLNGPSIFPVSSLGAQLNWTARQDLVLRAAVLDGVPGDPAHPKAFAAVRLSRRDGALVIGQAELGQPEHGQAVLGVWDYTASFDRIDAPGLRRRGWGGAFAYVQGPVPGLAPLKGWIRVGTAERETALVGGYLGAGIVRDGPLPGRPDDQAGLAVAQARLAGPIRRRDGLPDAETTVEATYRLVVSPHLALQPDVQWIRHPAAQPGLRDALAVGLRVAVTGKWAGGR